MPHPAYNGGVDEMPIDWVADRALHALEDGEAISPAATLLLLRRYVRTGRAELSEALGAALARAFERSVEDGETLGQCDWLALFVEAAAISDGERFLPAIASLARRVRGGWPSRGD